MIINDPSSLLGSISTPISFVKKNFLDTKTILFTSFPRPVCHVTFKMKHCFLSLTASKCHSDQPERILFLGFERCNVGIQLKMLIFDAPKRMLEAEWTVDCQHLCSQRGQGKENLKTLASYGCYRIVSHERNCYKASMQYPARIAQTVRKPIVEP